MRAAIDHFEQVAPPYMAKFIADFATFKIIDLDAAAAFGNFGTESLGLTVLQEMHPVVPGSRGGYGWPQWTGTRRRLYESFCSTQGLKLSDDASNYAYIKFELMHDYRGVLPKLTAVATLNAKVAAFERYYEGAGVVNLNSRIQWANVALNAFHKWQKRAGNG